MNSHHIRRVFTDRLMSVEEPDCSFKSFRHIRTAEILIYTRK